jgi:hypothetical protein
MGLPQELLDHIIDMLHDDIQALKACSLVCEAMFASTRRLIYYTLRLTPENALSVLTREEKHRYQKGNFDVGLRFLSFMDERGLLKCTQRVHIGRQFTPEILLPHLHRFQSLNHVQILTIDDFRIDEWVNYHTTGLAHFYPTLTSLALSQSRDGRGILNFALRFPNLENLSIEWLKPSKTASDPVFTDTSPVRLPPLRGCLRLVSCREDEGDDFEMCLFREPPKGLNFRSVELEDAPRTLAQEALNACAETVEDLTLTSNKLRTLQLPFFPSAIAISDLLTGSLRYIHLAMMPVLRRLTFHTTLAGVDRFVNFDPILSSIVSPVFCELVLEIPWSPPPFQLACLPISGDHHFERFAWNGDFRFIIRTSEPYVRELLGKQAKREFPLLASRGCIHLEMM